MAVSARFVLRYAFLGSLMVVFYWIWLAKKIFNPFWRYFSAQRLASVLRTPEDRFVGLEVLGYNFDARYVSLPIGGGRYLPRVHYVDEGPRDGPVLLCLHGEPSWSFLYRKMIPILAKSGYRVVAPDFIGFGKSDKYSRQANYTHEMHCMTLRLLMDKLSLTDVTLVCQDWGGLTGLSVVKDMPSRFSNIIVMNTGLPVGLGLGEPIPSLRDVAAFGVWRLMVEAFGQHLPLEFVFKTMAKMPPSVVPGYLAPFPDSTYTAGAAVWPRLVPLLRDDPVVDDMVQARRCLSEWGKPMLIMFSDKDPITGSFKKDFQLLVPGAKEITVQGAGHFLQESHGEICAENIVKYLRGEL